MTTFVGIDFEFANSIAGSICAYGLAFEDGSTEKEIIALHPLKGGTQQCSGYHHITPEETATGQPFMKLYERLQILQGDDIVLVAHDARIDRRAFHAACAMWNLPLLAFTWLDSLSVAKGVFGKNAKTGIATLAEKFSMAVCAHDPGDDALVALQVIQRYGLGTTQLVHIKAA